MAKLRFYQRQHSDRQQRVSAQIEEARVPAYPVQAQDAGPDTGKFLLHRANWRFISVQAIGAAIRRGQGLAIQFAIVREGHAIEADVSSRYHVFGQTCQEMRPQCFRPDVRASRIVGSQTLVPRAVLTCDDADLTDALALRQPGFDLAQLNAVSANLNLEVVAAQVLDNAVRGPAAEIPCFVHASAGISRERIGHKPLGRQIREVQIAPRNTGAAYVEFAANADGRGISAGVEDIDLRVRYRPTDRGRRRQRRIRRNFVDDAADNRFGWPILVHDAHIWLHLLPQPHR